MPNSRSLQDIHQMQGRGATRASSVSLRARAFKSQRVLHWRENDPFVGWSNAQFHHITERDPSNASSQERTLFRQGRRHLSRSECCIGKKITNFVGCSNAQFHISERHI